MKNVLGKDGNSWVRTYGIYIIVILALLRLLVYPLQAAIKDRKAILTDQHETYLMKYRLLDKMRQAKSLKASRDPGKALLELYPRETDASVIQVDMLTALSQLAEKKGLTVLGFEMPETVAGNKISEVPVVLKLSGGIRPFIELLKSIRENKKAIAVKTMEISVSGQEMIFSLTLTGFRMEV